MNAYRSKSVPTTRIIRGGWNFKKKDKNGKPIRGYAYRALGRLVYNQGGPARVMYTGEGRVYITEAQYREATSQIDKLKKQMEQQADDTT